MSVIFSDFVKRKWSRATTCRLLTFTLAAALTAQEGHPLVGSWHGTWGPDAKDRKDITFVLNYDGKQVTGLLNPGLDGVKFQQVTLDPADWTIHFEAETKDHVRVTGDRKLQDITSVRRSITGTWSQGSAKGDFKVTRDN